MRSIALVTRTRFLCTCAPGAGGCPYCLGLPGALPLPNRQAFQAGLAAAKALGLPAAARAALLRALDDTMPRGWRVKTTWLAQRGDRGIWIQEGEEGLALLCLSDGLDAEAAGAALREGGFETGAPVSRQERTQGWHLIADQPEILL